MIKNLFYTILLLLLSSLYYSQSLTVITSTVPGAINSCNQTQLCTINIENPSSFVLSGITTTVSLPQGINYVAGSITGGSESNVANLNNPVFSTSNISTLTSRTLSFLIETNCDALAFLNSGGIPKNSVVVNYTANGNNVTQNHNTSNYNISVPNLSVTAFSNQSIPNGTIGGNFTRCLTITNGGSGYLEEFTMTDVHGTGVTVNSIDVGTLINSGQTETITFTSADFMAFGDNDGRFETGERIVICENITVLNCSDVPSDYDIFWGCGGQQCQNTYTSANINFGFTTPNLKFLTPRSDLSTCHGVNSATVTHGLTITNIGNGAATNTLIDIYQSWYSGAYANSWLSSFDTASIMASINGGAPFHISPNATTPAITSGYSCPAVMIGQMFLKLPILQPSDTIVISWDVSECSIDHCTTNPNYAKGWYAKATYNNICDEKFYLDPIEGRVYDYFHENLASNLAPANITSGNTKTFNFLISTFDLSINNKNTVNDKFWYQIILPPCLTFANNFKVIDVNDNVLSTPSRTIIKGDTVLVELDNHGNYVGFSKGQLVFDLTANCASCGNTSGNYSIDVKSFYNTDTTCPNKNVYNLACFSSDIYVLCPVTCEGLNFIDFKVQRTNIGGADNNNDGLLDAVNTPDLTKVRLDRVMYRDTVSLNYKAYIGKLVTSPDFRYITYKSSITNGGHTITYVNGELTLYDLTTGTSHIASGILPTSNTLAGTTRSVSFELDINILAFVPSLPPGFLLSNGDTLNFDTRYDNTSNIGGAMFPCNITNDLYVSDITNATVSDQYACNNLEGYFTLIGYFFTESGTGIYSHKSCDPIAIGKYFYLSVGPWPSNYAGGNLFPFEYRPWSFDDTVTITMPGEYEFVDYSYFLISTSGNNTARQSSTYHLAPLGALIGTEFKFYTGVLYNDSIATSDDGYYSYSQITLIPTCNSPKDTSLLMSYKRTAQASFSSVPDTYNASHWLRYDAPRLQVQSLLPAINVYDSVAKWDLNISNTSNVSDANDLWISFPAISGITVTELYDVTNNMVITPVVNGIYQIGNLTASSQLAFKIAGDFTSCKKDSIVAHIGWGCQGYPTDLASYTCPTEQITFYTLPKTPALETVITSTNDSINLCDTSFYTVQIRNIQTGNAYNTMLTGTLPSGMAIIPGTSEIKLPGQASFIPYTNPINTTGNIWKWDLDTNFIEGIQTANNDAVIKFKFVTGCDYISGSQVSFYSVGNAACPYVSTSAIASSSPLVIKDAVQPYKTEIKIITDYISPCKGNTSFGIYLKNNGPLPFTSNDSIYIELPKDVNFVAGSFNGLYNAPSNGLPNINTQNIYEVLTWQLPNSIAVGDSVLFTFEAKANKDSLDCSILNIRAYSTSTSLANCTSSATSCTINTVTGDTNRNVFVYKSYLSLNNNNSTSILNATNGEIGYVSFDIYNTGDTISAGETTYASYYLDRDNNGVLSPADTNFLTTTNIQEIIGNNGTTNFLDTINIPAGYGCNIIVVLDSTNNACICSSVQLPLSFTLNQSLTDTVTCSNTPLIYAYDSVNGYTYNWTPTANLNGYNLANPNFIKANSTNQIDTTEYYIEIDRGGCLGYDTIEIATYPELTPNAGIDDSTCSAIYTLNGNTPRAFEQGIWISSPANPSTLVFSDSSSNNSTINGFIEGVYELYWGHFNGICDTIYDTVLISAFDIPFADAGLNDSLCNIYTYTFSANNPTGTSRGMWTQEITNPTSVVFDYDTAYNAYITGLIEGAYAFYWTVSDVSCPSVTDTLILDVFDQPIANAGVDDSLCNIYTYTLNGNQPTGRASGLWTQSPSNPLGANFDYDTAYNANISGLIEGTYELYWIVSNGNCTPVIDTVIIDVFNTPIANAGLDDSLCNLYTYTLKGNQPIGRAMGLWTQDPADISVATFDYDTAHNVNISGLVEGTYNLYWTVSNGNCASVTDTVVIDVFDTPTSNADINDSLCNIYTYTLNGNQPIGKARGLWMQNPTDLSVATFDYDTAYNANISGLIEGTYNFYWVVTNGNCTPAIDTVVIDVYDTPIANAGLDDSICGIYTYTLNANQPAGRATGLWTQSATNTTVATFNYDTLFNTTINNLSEGTYEFYWTVSNGNCNSVVDTVVLDVFDTPNPNAGLDDSLCNIYTHTLNGNKPAGRARGLWTQDPLNASVSVIDYDTAFNTNISGLIEGTYTYYWTISNGNCAPLTDTVIIDVFNTPTANAGVDDSICGIYTYPLNGNQPVGRARGIWTQAPTNLTGATFDFDTAYNANLTGLNEGTYTFYWTVSNGNCTPVVDTIVLDVFDVPTSFAGNDTLLCAQTTFTLNSNIPLGRATGLWTASNTNPSVVNITTPTNYSTGISNLVNGVYKFYWTVSSNGNCTDAIDSLIINNHPKPVASFISDLTTVCEEECILFDASSSSVNPLLGDNLVDYKWDFGNNTTGDNVTRTNCYNDSGDYTVSLIIEATSGCKDTLTQNSLIKVNPLPTANYSYLPEAPSVYNVVEFTDESTHSIAVKAFTISDGTINYSSTFQHTFNDTGYFDVKLFVMNIYGCTDSIENTIYIKNRLFVSIPNAFTPNGDGLNELFTPVIQNVVKDEYTLRVFNRWGDVVFETSEITNGWDGKFKGQMSPNGIYIWKINFREKDVPEIKTLTGHVTLIK